jgi:hypothetical protein
MAQEILQLGTSVMSAAAIAAIGKGTDPSVMKQPVLFLRDLPSNYFAIGRLHESRTLMLVDTREIMGERERATP